MSEDAFEDLGVLIVDDEKFSLKFLENILNGIGVGRVVAASDAGEALHILSATAAGELDLLIADIRMPEMDGYELTRRIRYGAAAAYKDIAILILTSVITDETLRRARTHRIDAQMAKPPSGDVLRLEIREALRHAAERAQA